jgi:carbonic anhydrase
MSTLSNNQTLDAILSQPTTQPTNPPPTIAQMVQLGKSSPTGFNIIITCADPRINVGNILPMPGSVIVRSAGGRAVDALRTLRGLNAMFPLGLVVVMHHTDCGMSNATDEQVCSHIKKTNPNLSAEDEKVLKEMDWGTIKDKE